MVIAGSGEAPNGHAEISGVFRAIQRDQYVYKINVKSNRIEALNVKSFTELGLSERKHLQEWLAHAPEALGEELLIIQKEFAGFDNTFERLDLLALDKDGRLVVIENKLDDSGKDVVWQALKYASYCSGLKKEQIVDMFQQYLQKQQGGEGGADARQVLREFFDGKDFEEIKLNPGNEQRIILVAAKFRKEVTSTALWLLGYRVRLQCFKVTPYERSQELYLNIDQIIPPPEAADYMIGIADKEQADQSNEAEVKTRHQLRLKFWTQALEAVRKSPCRLFDNVTPSDRGNAQTTGGMGIGAVWYSMVFGYTEARAQLYFDHKSEQENKQMFDFLFERRKQIEKVFGAELEWQRMDGLKAAQIRFSHDFNGKDSSQWPHMIAWLTEHIAKLELAFKEHLQEIRTEGVHAQYQALTDLPTSLHATPEESP